MIHPEFATRSLDPRSRLALGVVSILMAMPLWAATQSYPGVTVLDHPGGGTIAYARMPAQHTVQGAISKVMQYVAARFGGRPTVSHVLSSRDGNSLAVTFTVKATTESPGDVTGLALVAVSAVDAGKGAVLCDQSARFGKTVGGMLQQLRQAVPGGGATTARASASAPVPTAATSPPPTAPPPTAPAAVPARAAPAASPTGAATPIGPLHPTVFPDGSGTVGLPDGWKITGAHAGEVTAQGPAPAGLHFGFLVNAYDPGRITPASRFQIIKGSFSIPYEADVAAKMDAMTQQLAQLQHRTPPSVKVLGVQPLAARSSILIVDVTPSDGSTPLRAWTQVDVGPLNPAGTYFMTLYQILLPQQLSADEGNAAAKAIFGSYKADAQKALAELAAEKAGTDRTVAAIQRQTAANAAATQSLFAANQRAQDAQERSFAAADYALLGNTVVRDRDFSEHGLVSDNLADALTQADPNRFQEVPPSQYIKGVDY